MFIATHVPMATTSGDSRVPDKLIHFVMFAVLGTLLPEWLPRTVPLTLRRATWLFAVMAVYGAVDELLQIPVGRSAEWRDWYADLAGAAAGLVLAKLWRLLTER